MLANRPRLLTGTVTRLTPRGAAIVRAIITMGECEMPKQIAECSSVRFANSAGAAIRIANIDVCAAVLRDIVDAYVPAVLNAFNGC